MQNTMTIFDNDGFEASELEDIFQLFYCNMYVDIMDDNTKLSIC